MRIWFFWLFFIILSILGYFRYFSVFFWVQYRKCLILKKKIEKKIRILFWFFFFFFRKIFRIFTGFSVFLGIFRISGLPGIWVYEYWNFGIKHFQYSLLLNSTVIPFNTIEYWKCSIPKFQYYWIPKKFPIPKFNNIEKIIQYFSPP